MKFPLVEVEWRDAKNESDWRSVESITRKQSHTIVVRSVGYLLVKNGKEIVLAFGICDEGEVESYIAIPRDWCQKIRRIK